MQSTPLNAGAVERSLLPTEMPIGNTVAMIVISVNDIGEGNVLMKQ